MATNNAIDVQENTIARSGVNSDISQTNILSTIADSSGNPICTFNEASGSSINYINIHSDDTGTGPAIEAVGSDPNIDLILATNAGNVSLLDNTATIAPGVKFNNATFNHSTILKAQDAQTTDVTFVLPAVDGSSGYLLKTDGSGNLSFTPPPSGGATVSSVIPAGSAVSLTNGVAANITSISLSAGTWNVWGNVFILNTLNMLASNACWSSTTSATSPDSSLYNGTSLNSGVCQFLASSIPQQLYTLGSTTTIYLSCSATFSTGSSTGCGGIYALQIG